MGAVVDTKKPLTPLGFSLGVDPGLMDAIQSREPAGRAE